MKSFPSQSRDSKSIHYISFCLVFSGLDNDILPAKTVLKGLKKREIRDLFIELGLSDGTVEDCFETLGIDEYTHELLRHWINEKDDVGTKWKGGATWENLKAAMIKLKYGQEKNI